MISPTAHRSASVVFGHGLLPGLRPVRLRFGYAAERRRVDRKRIQDKDCFVITTRPPKRGKSTTCFGGSQIAIGSRRLQLRALLGNPPNAQQPKGAH